MRSRAGVFWYSLGLTLLLLIPLMAVTLFLLYQRQQQQELRQAAAERGGVQVEQGSQDCWRMLLVVQQEQPAFVLVRADGPARTVTLCALPGALQVSAPAGTTTLADCTLSAGPGRAVQLLQQTLATGETALPPLYYLAATPAGWVDFVGSASVRFDTASLLGKEARTALGYGEEPVVEVAASGAGEFIERLQSGLDTPGEKAAARAAVWAAFARQDPELLAAMPEAWRGYSARTLTDLLAQDLAGVEDTLTWLTGQSALTVDYCVAATVRQGGEVALTEAGSQTLYALLQ